MASSTSLFSPFLARYSRAALILAASMTGGSVFALTPMEAVLQFANNTRNYNLLTFGNATFRTSDDVEGPVAIGGVMRVTNLGLDIATQPSKYAASSDPVLYVGGNIQLPSGSEGIRVNNGYASLPGLVDANWTYSSTGGNKGHLTGKTGTAAAGDDIYITKSSFQGAAYNPLTVARPANFDFAAIQQQAIAEAQTFVSPSYAHTGLLTRVGQSLTFSAPANSSGTIIFDFYASRYQNGRYDFNNDGNYTNDEIVSSLSISVPNNAIFVINVLGLPSTGSANMFGSGFNINSGSVTGASRLLWNFGTTSASINFKNGGDFFGSILAPNATLIQPSNTRLSGQIVAGALDRQGAELHMVDFVVPDSLLPIPEPSTYGVMAALTLGVVVYFRRRRA